jgi:uncharacterized protein YjbJ (UPF0337 family)
MTPTFSRQTAHPTNRKGTHIMDKDRIAGSAKKFFGKVKEATGKTLGDNKTTADGKAMQVEGTIQNAVGGMKDSIRQVVKKK